MLEDVVLFGATPSGALSSHTNTPTPVFLPRGEALFPHRFAPVQEPLDPPPHQMLEKERQRPGPKPCAFLPAFFS